MHIEVIVKRQSSTDEKSYLQTFYYDDDADLTVADWLTEINQTEIKSDRIAWECGCMEKKCGACAMRINGVPCLACSVFLKNAAKRGKLLLEPLSKFPLVKDLVVDRSSMFQMLLEMKVWTQEKEQSTYGQDNEFYFGNCFRRCSSNDRSLQSH